MSLTIVNVRGKNSSRLYLNGVDITTHCSGWEFQTEIHNGTKLILELRNVDLVSMSEDEFTEQEARRASRSLQTILNDLNREPPVPRCSNCRHVLMGVSGLFCGVDRNEILDERETAKDCEWFHEEYR